MNIRLRGVRGSSPTPLTPEAVKSKIAAVVQRIKPADLVSPESRELFLSRLPDYLFGTTGSNTACIEARLDSKSSRLNSSHSAKDRVTAEWGEQ
ncbi:MAG: hypothetical protein PQJ50_07245, partial [Spirochaetales bacterium]|nr:hypothetical protein [Spirochaetales bacterium]